MALTTPTCADIGWSPDGSYFVVAATGGYNGGTLPGLRRRQPVQRLLDRADGHPGVDRLHRHDSHLLGGGHLSRGVRRWPQPLAEQPVRQDNVRRRARSRGPAWPPSTRPTAYRCPGTPAATLVATAPRWSTRPPPASGSAATPTTSATPSTSTRSWRSSPSPAALPATGDNAGDPHTVFVGRRGRCQHPHRQHLRPDDRNRLGRDAPSPSTGGGIAWGSIQGAFVLNGRIWYGSGGKFYYRTWDGANDFGAAAAGRPVRRSLLGPVQTGSGQTYQGTATSFYAELPKVTGMFYANRSIYYTLSGSKNLSAGRSRPTPGPPRWRTR